MPGSRPRFLCFTLILLTTLYISLSTDSLTLHMYMSEVQRLSKVESINYVFDSKLKLCASVDILIRHLGTNELMVRDSILNFSIWSLPTSKLLLELFPWLEFMVIIWYNCW